MAGVRFTPQRIGAIIFLLLGLILMVRLVLLQSRPPATLRRPTATIAAGMTVTGTVTDIAEGTTTPVSAASRRTPLPLITTRPLTRTIPPDFSATPSPSPTATPPRAGATPTSVSVQPTPIPPTAIPPTVAPPTAVPPTAVPPTATAPPPTPTPTRTLTPTPSVRPRLINNEIDPPWWPCSSGQVKVSRKLGIYHTPEQPGYRRAFVSIDCFDSEQAAIAAGYRRAQE